MSRRGNGLKGTEMSRLCRLKTKTHGEDGQWAYEEITKLREQVADLRKENSIERNLRVGVEAVFDTLNEDIGRLKAERDELKAQWNYYQDFCKSHNANGITDLVVQRDAALAENAAYYQLAKKEVWASVENKLLAQAAVIESLKSALTGLLAYNPEQEWIGGAENGYYQTVGTCRLKEIQQAKAALAIPTDSTQILAEVRRAERERVAQFVDDNCTYGDTHILVKAIRAME